MLARIAVCFAVASIVIEARADGNAAAGWDGPDNDADHARWEQAWLDGHSRRATGGEPGSARRARRSPDTSATEMSGLPDGSARTFSAAGAAGNDEASPSRECGVASNCGGLGGWRVILLATQADAPVGSDPSATEPVEDPDEPVQNLAPDGVGSINDQTLTVGGEPARVDAARYFSDPDGDDLTYQASSSDDGVATVTVSGSDVTVAPGVEGTATITVTARDPGGLMAEQTFEVTVSSAGAADLVVESPAVTEANVGKRRPFSRDARPWSMARCPVRRAPSTSTSMTQAGQRAAESSPPRCPNADWKETQFAEYGVTGMALASRGATPEPAGLPYPFFRVAVLRLAVFGPNGTRAVS